MSIYFNTNRKNQNSSQQETVKLIHSGIFSTVDSYQKFNINKTLLDPIDNQLKLKSNLLKPILDAIKAVVGAVVDAFHALTDALGLTSYAQEEAAAAAATRREELATATTPRRIPVNIIDY